MAMQPAETGINKINRDKFIRIAGEMFPNTYELTREEVLEVCSKASLSWPSWLAFDPAARTHDSKYVIAEHHREEAAKSNPKMNVKADDNIYELQQERIKKATELAANKKRQDTFSEAALLPNVAEIDRVLETIPTPITQTLVPEKAVGYVPFGHYKDVKAIVEAKIFYPMYITGLSGNGKTLMVEEIHADLGRELVRVNITIETDEDDLLGGFRLVNGKTVWHDGPVVIAMEHGCTLLLDEVDLGSNKMMCLQPVLEGRGIYLKKINRTVNPAPGFNIIATANTKGKGSEDGRFIGTNVQNEAFLDRFSATFEQEYPANDVEEKILANALAKHNMTDPGFVTNLVKWASNIRNSFRLQSVSEVISTRRLVSIVDAYSVFKDRKKAIELCIARFDDEYKNSFMALYASFDESVSGSPTKVTSSLSSASDLERNRIRPV